MHISDIAFLPQMLGNGEHNVCWCDLGIDVTCDSVAHDLEDTENQCTFLKSTGYRYYS
jgi:hypothetical protein